MHTYALYIHTHAHAHMSVLHASDTTDSDEVLNWQISNS